MAENIFENGYDEKRIANEYPRAFIMYWRGLRQFANALSSSTKRHWKTTVHVYVGEPGTGKSKYASERGGDRSYYKPRGIWWDGYAGESTIIIDDFYGWIKYDEMLRLCDEYPHKVEIKGGYVEFIAKDIYITSNKYIKEWYKFNYFNENALLRRVNEYKEFYIENDEYKIKDLK